MAKLLGNLPDENGLNTAGKMLFDDPAKVIPVVGLVVAAYTKHNYESGLDEMYVKLKQVEIIDDSDFGAAERLLRRGAERRTGNEMLPIDLEDELSQVFAGYVPSPDPDDMPEPEPGEEPDDDSGEGHGPDFSDGGDRG